MKVLVFPQSQARLAFTQEGEGVRGSTQSLSTSLAQSGFLSIALGSWASWFHRAIRRPEVGQMAAERALEMA